VSIGPQHRLNSDVSLAEKVMVLKLQQTRRWTPKECKTTNDNAG